MTSAPSVSSSTRKAVLVCSAAMISLAIAMGVGRFAFTPMFPLMVRDGLLNNENWTLLAASNYLGVAQRALGRGCGCGRLACAGECLRHHQIRRHSCRL